MSEEDRVVHRVMGLSGSEGNLESLINNRIRKGLKVSEEEVIRYVAQICIGLV